MFKVTVWTLLRGLRLWQRRSALKPRPSFTKYYDVRPNLECRVFLPHTTTTSTSTFPLYINIHGGGFALCDPAVDDHFASTFSRTHSILVVSINYRKSPLHPFPAPVSDVVALTNAVIADPLLPIDRNRVALGGFSAGGNLTLAAALHPSLKAKLTALLPIYPVVDFSGKYKGTFRPDPRGNADMLKNTGSWFNWAYIPPGTDRKHPLLSPIYAPRAAFAATKMLFVGAEYDYLCREAYALATQLAVDKTDVEVEEDVSLFPTEWDREGIRWWMARGQQHGFTHTRKSGVEEKERREATVEVYREMGRWLREDVWGMQGKADSVLE
jgi:acetyl esterase/lipase